MATKKEIKEFLKESGYTESDMQKFWEENIETNKVIGSLNKYGKTWKDLNLPCIKQLPTQKQRDLDYIKNKEMEEKRIMEEKKKQEELEEWKKEHFEEYILGKIDKDEDLTEDEIKRLVWDYEVEQEEGDSGRWTQSMTSYVKLLNRFFVIYWESGLTECQENEYLEQPEEVERVEYDKLIPEHYEHVVEWRTVK